MKNITHRCHLIQEIVYGSCWIRNASRAKKISYIFLYMVPHSRVGMWSKMDLKHSWSLWNLLKDHSKDQNDRMGRSLRMAEKHYQKTKTQGNSEKLSIGGLNNEMHSSREIWPINGPDLIGGSQWAVEISGYWCGPYKTCDGDWRSQLGPSIKHENRWATLHCRISIRKYKERL